jgi:hypothetical protein
MRFMTMHKFTADFETLLPPSPELMARMDVFFAEGIKQGSLLGGEGLKGRAERTRVTVVDGVCTVQPGPYEGRNELPARISLIKVKTADEAVEWATRYAKVIGDGELELGPVVEPWDMGYGDKPAGAPLRYLLLHKADARYEAGQAPTGKQKAGMTRLTSEMNKAGVLVSTVCMVPGSQSTRVLVKNHERTVVDGPFAESKELIAGYGLLSLESRKEAIDASFGFAEAHGGTLEIDIRPVCEDPYLEA